MPTIAERAQILQPALGRLLSVITMLCLRGAGPLSVEMLFSFYLGLTMLAAVWLREQASRVLIRFTRWSDLPAIHQYGANHV